MAEDKNYICVNIANCTLITCISLLLLMWPASEIYMGYTYRDQITCTTTMFVTLSEWLIIKGSITIFSMFLILPMLLSNRNSICYGCIIIPIYISYLTTFSWLIIGSIIFWRDCINTEPVVINAYMWVSLIFGYIAVLNSPKNNDNDQKNLINREPALYIA